MFSQLRFVGSVILISLVISFAGCGEGRSPVPLTATAPVETIQWRGVDSGYRGTTVVEPSGETENLGAIP